MSQFYIGNKKVFAWPERKGDRDGYHVVYQYGLPNEYHSWSPKTNQGSCLALARIRFAVGKLWD
jgi:hypothetical protein